MRCGLGQTLDVSRAMRHPNPARHACEEHVRAVDYSHFKYSGDYIIENLTSMHHEIGLLVEFC